jgi:NAD(P)-dependent dehydrogenase (short-subunit alcohol dehydrogenase family)
MGQRPPSNPRFKGLCVIVTGAGGASGAAVASRFAAEGGLLVCVDRDLSSAIRTTEEIVSRGGSAAAVEADPLQVGSGTRIAAAASHSHSRIDILVNHVETADEIRGLSIACLPLLRSGGGGAILHLFAAQREAESSASSLVGRSDDEIRALTARMARELGPAIRVNSVSPGSPAISPASKPFGHAGSPEPLRGSTREPGRHLGPRTGLEELAGVILFLASQEASFITGRHLIVREGRADLIL